MEELSLEEIERTLAKICSICSGTGIRYALIAVSPYKAYTAQKAIWCRSCGGSGSVLTCNPRVFYLMRSTIRPAPYIDVAPICLGSG